MGGPSPRLKELLLGRFLTSLCFPARIVSGGTARPGLFSLHSRGILGRGYWAWSVGEIMKIFRLAVFKHRLREARAQTTRTGPDTREFDDR